MSEHPSWVMVRVRVRVRVRVWVRVRVRVREGGEQRLLGRAEVVSSK